MINDCHFFICMNTSVRALKSTSEYLSSTCVKAIRRNVQRTDELRRVDHDRWLHVNHQCDKIFFIITFRRSIVSFVCFLPSSDFLWHARDGKEEAKEDSVIPSLTHTLFNGILKLIIDRHWNELLTTKTKTKTNAFFSSFLSLSSAFDTTKKKSLFVRFCRHISAASLTNQSHFFSFFAFFVFSSSSLSFFSNVHVQPTTPSSKRSLVPSHTTRIQRHAFCFIVFTLSRKRRGGGRQKKKKKKKSLLNEIEQRWSKGKSSIELLFISIFISSLDDDAADVDLRVCCSSRNSPDLWNFPLSHRSCPTCRYTQSSIHFATFVEECQSIHSIEFPSNIVIGRRSPSLVYLSIGRNGKSSLLFF